MRETDNIPQSEQSKPDDILLSAGQSKLEDIPESKPLDDSQVISNAGGQANKVDDFSLLRRLIILGSGENYYCTVEKRVTLDNAEVVLRLLAAGQGKRVVAEVAQISKETRAPRQTPGIFVLAVCARLGDVPTRAAALAVLPVVCRTPYTLFEFVQYCKELGPVTLAMRAGAAAADPAAVLAWIEQARLNSAVAEADVAAEATAKVAANAAATAATDTATAEASQVQASQPAKRRPMDGKPSWGRSFRRAISHWYLKKTPVEVAYQVTKYVQRHGWSHADLLRLAHPDPEDFAAKRRELAAAIAAEATVKLTGEADDAPGNAATEAAAVETTRWNSEVAGDKVGDPCDKERAGEDVRGDGDLEQEVLAAAVAAVATANAATAHEGLMTATEAVEAAFVADMKAIFEFLTHGTLPGQERKQRRRKPKDPPAAETEVDAPVAASEALAEPRDATEAREEDTLAADAEAFITVATVVPAGKKAAASDAYAAGAAKVSNVDKTTDVSFGSLADAEPTSAGTPPGPDTVTAVPLSPVMQYIVDAHMLRKVIRVPPPLVKKPKPPKGWPVFGPRRNMHDISNGRNRNQGPAGCAPSGPTELEVAAHNTATAAAIEMAVSLIRRHQFGHKHVGDVALLREPEIWATFLEVGMPLTVVIRNLGRMTQIGVMKRPECVRTITTRLRDPAALTVARVHPMSMLEAMCTYSSGGGMRGVGRWEAVTDIYDALMDAFYLSFKCVKPTGRRFLIGMDVSDSMTGPCSAMMSVPRRVAAAAMAMTLVRTEPWAKTLVFSHSLIPVEISPEDKLEDVLGRTRNIPFGTTDCARPMIFATEWGLDVDVFIILTDNETCYGKIHPAEALRRYRGVMGKSDAKLVVLGLSSTGFGIADPTDIGMLDVAGWDDTVPWLVADFADGKL